MSALHHGISVGTTENGSGTTSFCPGRSANGSSAGFAVSIAASEASYRSASEKSVSPGRIVCTAYPRSQGASARSLSAPNMPSGVRPRERWKACRALFVAPPNMPSGAGPPCCARESAVCMSATSAPVEPVFKICMTFPHIEKILAGMRAKRKDTIFKSRKTRNMETEDKFLAVLFLLDRHTEQAAANRRVAARKTKPWEG